MNLDRFFQTLPSQYERFGTPEVVSHSDPDFERIVREIPCFTNPTVITLLSHAVRHLQPNEVYVESGCWNGASLIGALIQNPNAFGIGVDNFSEFGGSLMAMHSNIERFDLQERVSIATIDCQKFWQGYNNLYDRPVGIYFYDANHEYDEVLANLKFVVPHLAPEALIVVDDDNWTDVHQAVLDFLKNEPRASLRLSLPTPENMHPTWWNGLAVIAWESDNEAI